MAGASFAIKFSEPFTAAFNRVVSSLERSNELLDMIGLIIERQTRRRISEEKAGPNGLAWEPWSAAYAATRHGEHSMLINEGHLFEVITHNVYGKEVHVGVDRVYGAVHQFGRGRIPARPYLGLSNENEDEVTAIVTDYLAEVLDE